MKNKNEILNQIKKSSNKIETIEGLIQEFIEEIIDKLISINNIVNIRAKSRAGAEISDWIEEKFVNYLKENNFECIKSPQQAPKGQTKNPWDARFWFNIENLISEEVWIDFKAFKKEQLDSNPDVGTPNKLFKFIDDGGFYILFIYIWYEDYGENIKFIKNNGKYSKVYFLKDINKSFRRNPKNQLQVNVSVAPTHRTKIEFIEVLKNKLKESYIRQIELANEGIKKLDKIDKYKEKIKKRNEDILKIINDYFKK